MLPCILMNKDFHYAKVGLTRRTSAWQQCNVVNSTVPCTRRCVWNCMHPSSYASPWSILMWEVSDSCILPHFSSHQVHGPTTWRRGSRSYVHFSDFAAPRVTHRRLPPSDQTGRRSIERLCFADQTIQYRLTSTGWRHGIPESYNNSNNCTTCRPTAFIKPVIWLLLNKTEALLQGRVTVSTGMALRRMFGLECSRICKIKKPEYVPQSVGVTYLLPQWVV